MSDAVADFDALLDAYVDDVPPRLQVPSVREVDGGVVDYEFRPIPPPPKPTRPSPVKRFFADLKQLMPWRVATRETFYPLLILSGLATAGPYGDTVFRSVLFFVQTEMAIDVGAMIALIGLMDLVGQLALPVLGYLTDRFKRVYFVRTGSLLNGACAVLTGLAPNPLTMALSRVGAALGTSVSQAGVSPLLADYFEIDKRPRVFGFQQLATMVWAIASTMVLVYGIYITGALSWRQLIVGAGVLSMSMAMLTFFLREPVRGEADRRSLGVSEEVAKQEQKPVSWSEAWRVCRGVGTLRKLWYATPFLWVAQVGTGLILSVAMQSRLVSAYGGGGAGIFGVVFTNSTLSRIVPVLFMIVPSLMQIVMTPIAFGIADRLLKKNPGRIMVFYGLIMAALGVSSVVAVLTPNPLMAMPFSFVIGTLAGIIAPAQSMLLSLVIPARVRGQGFQTVAWFRIFGIVIVMLLGGLVGTLGPTGAVIALLPVLFVGAGILVFSGADVGRDIQNAAAASLAHEESAAARARGTSKMIVMRDVGVFYDSAQVLFDVDLDVEDGELVAVLGTNGAGKSTLLRVVAGLHEPTTGAVFRDGEDVTHKPAFLNARDGIVFLPGGRAVFPTLSVEENLSAAAWLYKEDQEYVRTRTEEVLSFFPILRERLKAQAGDLSGGEQQMLALGQAFLMRPRLLMIDELSLGLAPQVVERLLEIVRAIHAQGTTVLLVEQSVNVALTIARRAVFLDHGEVLFDGPTEDLLHRPDLVRAVFLGHTGGTGLVGAGRRRRSAGETEAVLAVDDVAVSYGGVRALDGVGLSVAAGEIVGIIGPNGAGKTTLFDVVSGFIQPERGTVAIAGVDAAGLPPDARARLGLARSFQHAALFPSLTVRETIAVALRRDGSRNPVLAAAWAPSVRNAERRAFRRVEYLVEVMSLGPHADKFLGELSTGTRRMVDIACVMASEPQALLLDEPSSGLAQAEIEVFGPVVQQLAREMGCGVLVIEHDIPLITDMSDRLVAMELGRVIAEGDARTVSSDPRVLSAYLSASDAVINRSGALRQALETLQATAGGPSS